MAELALKYEGAAKGSSRHHDLINTFNRVHPHGEHMTYSRAWCAATVTAWLIKGGYTTKNMPMSCSCAQLIRDTKALEKKGLAKWVENDAWKGAEPGDLVIYYWYAEKHGDCKKYTSHVGMIIKRTSTGYVVLEGNYGGKVKRRTIPYDYRYIRGFCHLHYQEAPSPVGKLAVDGVFGPKSVTRLQQYLGTSVDGIISGQKKAYRKYYKGIADKVLKFGTGGSLVIKALQRKVGAKDNGVLDKESVKALQKFLKIVEDGKWGKVTSKALQSYLNDELKK